jgi:hypothetical protein
MMMPSIVKNERSLAAKRFLYVIFMGSIKRIFLFQKLSVYRFFVILDGIVGNDMPIF